MYSAQESGLLMLPLMGARTAFDRAMYLKIKDPGGFKVKLAENEGRLAYSTSVARRYLLR